jgi:hypothetical protein
VIDGAMVMVLYFSRWRFFGRIRILVRTAIINVLIADRITGKSGRCGIDQNQGILKEGTCDKVYRRKQGMI